MKYFILKIVIIYSLILFIIPISIFAQNNIETKIKNSLPENTLLREIEKIPETKVDSYIGLYIVNPVISEVPLEDEFGFGLYYTCPEQTLGQTIKGIYHLFLYQNNSIKSDIIIPLPYSENNSMKQELCYFNTEYNLCWHFSGNQDCEGMSKTNLKKAKLIKFKDCTGTKKKQDFVLVGSTEACGFINYLIAGYNEELNKVEIYDIQNGNQISQWYSRFYPDEQGEVVIEILCGDHGNETYTKSTYRFNKSSREFELVETVEKDCE